MSLAARVTALAQAVGADIKDLRGKVAVTQTASAINNPGTPTVVSVNQAAGSFGVLPLPTNLNITSSDGVNPDYTRNADGSLTFNKAGTYLVSATAGSAGTPYPGTAPSTFDLRFVLTAPNKAGSPDNVDPLIALERDLAPNGEYAIRSLAAEITVVAGQKLGCVAFHGATGYTASLGVLLFGVTRTGSGPVGPQGPVGPAGPMGSESYISGGSGGTVTGNVTIPFAAPTKASATPPFQRNSDGTLTCLIAGYYNFAISILNMNGIAGGTQLQYGLEVAGTTYGTTMTYPVWAHGSVSAGMWVDVGQMARAYVSGVGTAAQQCAVQWYSVSRAGGPQGAKGDTGGNATVPLDTWHNVGDIGSSYGAAAGWAPASVIGQLIQFRKDLNGKVYFRGVAQNKGGAFGFGNATNIVINLPVGYRPAWLQDGAVIVTEPNGSTNSLVQARANTDGTVALLGTIAGFSTSGGQSSYVRFDGFVFDTDAVTQVVSGPQGPKGDAGGITNVKTLDWNTATAPNLYKSTNDFLEKTLHGPGDTLNPPPQAGVAYTHDNGEVVQRAWDLSTGIGWTRMKGGDGNWTAWAPDLTKPLLLIDQTVGLPTPLEGEERYFQNAAMKALGILWKFRYDATAPAGKPKWCFAGGMPWLTTNDGDISMASGATLLENDIAITLPLNGDYMIEHGARMYNTSAPGYGRVVRGVRQMRGATQIQEASYMDFWNSNAPALGGAISITPSLSRVSRWDGLVSSDVILPIALANNASATFNNRWLKVTPIRVVM